MCRIMVMKTRIVYCEPSDYFVLEYHNIRLCNTKLLVHKKFLVFEEWTFVSVLWFWNAKNVVCTLLFEKTLSGYVLNFCYRFTTDSEKSTLCYSVQKVLFYTSEWLVLKNFILRLLSIRNTRKHTHLLELQSRNCLKPIVQDRSVHNYIILHARGRNR